MLADTTGRAQGKTPNDLATTFADDSKRFFVRRGKCNDLATTFADDSKRFFVRRGKCNDLATTFADDAK